MAFPLMDGWMDQELFDKWFCNHFLRYALCVRPILLLLDGHSSHYCPDTIRLAAQGKVIIFALPPNTTHLTQPLDKGCFGPLKMAWQNVCHKYVADNPGKVVTKYQFSPLFKQAWMQSMTVGNITGGFKVTGVYPLNRSTFCVPDNSENLPEETGLAFIPLYSPAGKRTKEVSQDDFTMEEIELFQIRYENGYDISTDSRYNDWLAKYHPESERMKLLKSTCSSVSQFLHIPSPPSTIPTFRPKSCGRVLTSTENLQLMAEKEREKQEKRLKKAQKRRGAAQSAEGKAAGCRCLVYVLYTFKIVTATCVVHRGSEGWANKTSHYRREERRKR